MVDALEMMEQGVERLLVPKGVPWRGTSKKFSIPYNGRWLKSMESSGNANRLSSLALTCTLSQTKYCCLSREDIIRFLIGCLGALAPIPLSSISTLGAINPHYYSIEASAPAILIETNKMHPQNPSAIAVVEPTTDGYHEIIGDISACKLCKCDYLATAYAMANLSACQFMMGVEENLIPGGSTDDFSNSAMLSSRRSIQLIFNARIAYRERSAALTCKPSSSLAAVMAQMLSHRSTHVWVTEGVHQHVIVGVISYVDILYAVTKPLPLLLS